MELAEDEQWFGGVPPWLDAVGAGDVLTASDLAWQLDWDDLELADAAGQSLPAEILVQVAAMRPGGEAITLLESLSERQLTADQRLTVVQLWQPLLAWAAGAETSAWLDFAGPETPADITADPVTPDYASFTSAELAAAELGPALGCTVDFAKKRIGTARQLGEGGQFARVGGLLREGVLSDYRCRLLLSELVLFEPAIAERVQDVVLDRAAALSPTTLKRLVRRTGKRLVGSRDPEQVLESFVAAQRTRRVGFSPDVEDNLVLMWAYLPPLQALAIQQHLERAAGGRDNFDGRSVDERRADYLTSCILGSDPDRPRLPLAPTVQLNVLVPLSTLLDKDDHPGELGGFGDLPPAIVRSLASDAKWRRWLFDDADGHLIDLGKHRYTPDAELGGYLKARDPICRFPHSTRSSANADLDHVEAFDRTGSGHGGSTSAENMTMLSRFPHRLKTHAGHKLTALGKGILSWTTPLGRVYRLRPHDYRPDHGDDPPPEASASP
ncbi:MAG: hypothetical protein QOE24_2102 [Frankiales bacterium]|nr:hypothetical protein [Frankiales bacterium]